MRARYLQDYGIGLKCVSIVALVLASVLGRLSAADDLESFFATSTTRWTAFPDSLAVPEFITMEGRDGYRFTCDFSQVTDRCRWDAEEISLDLSQAASLSFWVSVTNAEAIRSLSLYVKCGTAWRAQSFQLQEGWNNLEANLEKFGYDGDDWSSSRGWEKIDAVRVSIWKLKDGLATVSLVGIRLDTQPVAKEELGEESEFQWPIEDKELERLVRRDDQGRLLESRMIFDEEYYMKDGASVAVDKIARAGFNVYMPGAWIGDGAMYRSKTSILSPRWSEKILESDPMGELIRLAHERDIEVHPSFIISNRSSDIYPEYSEVGSPIEAKGHLRGFDLQNPKFRDFIVSEIVNFSRIYDIDGINLDYIRTLGISFSPTARRLYREKYGVDIDELRGQMSSEVQRRFLEWQEGAVSDIVRRVSEGVKAVRPKAIISICGHPLPKPTMSVQGRNEWLWVERGWVDVVYDMDYARRPNISKMEQVRAASSRPECFAKVLGNYEPRVGRVDARGADLVVRQVEYFLRKFPERGIGLYLYGRLSEDQVRALRAGPFKENAVASWDARR